MAEAVIEESHPLDAYIEESIDDAFSVNMPGTSQEIHAAVALDLDDVHVEERSWRRAAQWAFENVSSFLELTSLSRNPSLEFAERFKYLVISSSLLDSSLSSSTPSHSQFQSARFLTPPATPLTADSTTPQPPQHRTTHHRFPNPDLEHDHDTLSPSDTPLRTQPTTKSKTWRSVLTTNAPLAVVLFVLVLNGYVVIAFFTLFTLKTAPLRHRARGIREKQMLKSHRATAKELDTLIEASRGWNEIVNDAMSVLENEERQLFYGPAPTSSPSTSLRVALSSTLLSTQSQMDNVRQLFSPLTSQSSLSRLSEMYAPPPPRPPPSTPSDRPASLSVPKAGRLSMIVGREKEGKRSTWDGVGALRRSMSLQGIELKPAFGVGVPGGSSSKSSSVMSTPPPRRLSTVFGEDIEGLPSSSSSVAFPGILPLKEDPFTSTPPRFKRRRRNSSLTLGGLSMSRPPSLDGGHSHSRTQSSSHLTHSRSHNCLQTTRHPLSLTALHDQVQSTLGSKRFTAAHLLALRFLPPPNPENGELELLDGEDESYWEDVRSVMALFVSTLQDASERLHAALGESQDLKDQDSRLSPAQPLFSTSTPLPSSGSVFTPAISSAGFAPSPTHIVRFANHVNALVDAMENAKRGLRVAASQVERFQDQEPDRLESALQSYDRVRKDLSSALREFERGRGSLLDLIKVKQEGRMKEEERESDEEDGVMSLSSNEEPESEQHHQHQHPDRLLPVHAAMYQDAVIASGPDQDVVIVPDHGPMDGIEQVFSFDAAKEHAPVFRERSKLSREERIAQSKVKRSTPEVVKEDNWGPGGEVVQELKNVISRVDERRKKEASKRLSVLGELATAPDPAPPVIALDTPGSRTDSPSFDTPPPTASVGVAL